MRNRATIFTIGFAILGLLIIVLYVISLQGMNGANHQGLQILRALENVKADVTKSQLALQRYVSGDNSVSVDELVNNPIQNAKRNIQAIYDNNLEGADLSLFQDEDSRALVKQASVDLQRLLETGQIQWKAGAAVAPIPATDSTMASVPVPAKAMTLDDESATGFERNYTSLDRIRDHASEKIGSRVSGYNVLSWVATVLLILALIGVVAWLFMLQLSSRKMIEAQDAQIAQNGKAVDSLSEFIESISAGNFAADVALDDDGNNLKTSLLNMRDKLKVNAEDDRRRNWSTSGLAQIGDILRANTSSVTELYDSIIKFVVRYTRSNQGGLFILSEEDETENVLELVSCYAFERKKYLSRQIGKGEGLVGQCFLEGERIYLLEVPSQYIAITSGLGGASPNALLLVPLKVNDRIFGVIELATFGKYEPHEIELVEKLAESIASTISSVRISESTRILLEKTQQQAEEMRAQEEEMRQNMEELEATQEEMRRKEKHIQNMLDGEKKRNEISHKNRQLVMELTKNKDIQEGKWIESLEKMTSSMARQLATSRASVWELISRENKLVCARQYDNDRGSFEAGKVRTGRDYPGFFEALTREEIINVADALDSTVTKELAAEYRNDDIRSVLIVPFFSEGKIAGVIICEHQREMKEWTDEDIEFLKSCADLVTVTFNTSRINAMLEQLSDDQETMQTIIDNIPRAVFWKDKELRFQGCNRIFAEVAGLKSPGDLVGKTDHDMPWKEHADAYMADDTSVMNSRKARLDLEERNVNSEGVESWVLTSKVPVLNKHAEVVAVLGMFEDITERKRKEAQVDSDMKELEELRRVVKKQAS